jgi:16S rRNA (cytosine967-C5)-methyltransferase
LLAARAVTAVLGGQSLTTALPEVLDQASPQDRPLIRQLAFGCIRWQPTLQAVFQLLAKKPLRRRDHLVHALALLGIEQILHTRIPDHAAVSATVAAVRNAGAPRWAPGFVNGLLRNLLRDQDALVARARSTPAGRYAHPDWLCRRIESAWPDRYRQILDANNSQAPMTLRVALDRSTRRDYLTALTAAGREATEHEVAPAAVTLSTPCDVSELPGFGRGLVSVQDAAAQLAVPLLDLAPGQRVLDACAAPGGKTGHILEAQPGLSEVVAVDLDQDRLVRVTETLDRLGRGARTLVADASQPDAWWDGMAFDRILLDVPCSGSGVIRRHPDIKLLRRESDFGELAARQRRILDAIWPLLAPGGVLLYTTCSIMPEENGAVVTGFLAHQDDATAEELQADWGDLQPPGRQILPGQLGMDGFFFARLRKSPVATHG